jgi:hypothetical protein
MALKIIGSGFGRTGTASLKRALEALDFGPCHHMEEVFANPAQVPHWQAVAAGKPVNWDEVFAGYRSQVDWPGAHVWRELAAAYPHAKVIHTERPRGAMVEKLLGDDRGVAGRYSARGRGAPAAHTEHVRKRPIR